MIDAYGSVTDRATDPVAGAEDHEREHETRAATRHCARPIAGELPISVLATA